MLVTKTIKTVTKISNLSSEYFVFNISFQTLRDCLKSIQNEDYCLSMLATPTTSNPAGHRIKRTSSPIVEKSFLREIQTQKQVCGLPCQRRPLLVDKKKILGYLGFGHLVSQLNGFGFTIPNITLLMCNNIALMLHQNAAYLTDYQSLAMNHGLGLICDRLGPRQNQFSLMKPK